jgi:hypothetical protein
MPFSKRESFIAPSGLSDQASILSHTLFDALPFISGMGQKEAKKPRSQGLGALVKNLI